MCILAYCEYPDKMLHAVAFDQNLDCLPRQKKIYSGKNEKKSGQL